MNKKYISSKENPLYKNTIKLKNKEGYFFIEGKKIIEEALINPSLNFLYILKTEEFNDLNPEINKLITQKRIPEIILDFKLIKKISDLENPPGIIGVAQMKVRKEEKIEKDSLFLFLDRIKDPGNMGSIFRISEAFDVTSIFISKDSVSPFNIKVIRSSSGSIFRVNFFWNQSLKEKILYFKKKGMTILSTSPHKGTPIFNMKFKKPVGIIFGEESSGESSEYFSISKNTIKIPLPEKMDSLNVSTAASIILYEIKKQENLD